jgi:RimJ/RimL family protein N-acetyltransferase
LVTIEPLLPERFGLAARWLSQPEVNAWLGAPWRGRAVGPVMVSLAAHSPRNLMYLVRSAQTTVGLVCLSDLEPDDRTAMVWYCLGETSLRGKGMTSQALQHLCDLAFGRLGLHSLHAWITEPNIASRRVLEKAGFTRAGQIRRASSVGGQPVDRILFDRVAEVSPSSLGVDQGSALQVPGSVRRAQ